MDDFDFIVNWPLIQDLSNWPRFFVGYVTPETQTGIYSPLKTLFHALNYHFFGLNVLGYHIESIIVHALGVFCVYFICRFLVKPYVDIKESLIPILAALIFAVHPVQVELTVSMTGAVDLIGVVFMLASMLFYLYYLDYENINHRWYALSLLTGSLAVFTHELVVSLPLLLLLCDHFYRRNKVNYTVRFLALAPFFFVSLFYVISKFLVLGSISRNTYLYDSFYLTILVTLKALGKYVLISLFPFVLTHNHQIAPGIFSFGHSDFDPVAVLSQSLFDPYSILSILILFMIFWGAVSASKRYPFLLFSAGWFFLSLLPGLNIIPSGVYFAERYLYPGFGAFCVAVAWLIVNALEKYSLNRSKRNLLIVAVVSLLTFYYIRSWARVPDLRDDIALFESAVRATPRSALMHNDLGIVYSQYGFPEKAVKSFNKALSIREDPETYFALADAYTQLGQYIKTVEALERAIIMKPDYPEALFNLAGVYFFMGEEKKALMHFEESVRILKDQKRETEAMEYEKTWSEYLLSQMNEE
jgi:Flp pilus assembly protein TadD